MLVVDGVIKLLTKLKVAAPIALFPTNCKSSLIQMRSFWTYLSLTLDN
jgi:hypothetical protein